MIGKLSGVIRTLKKQVSLYAERGPSFFVVGIKINARKFKPILVVAVYGPENILIHMTNSQAIQVSLLIGIIWIVGLVKGAINLAFMQLGG